MAKFLKRPTPKTCGFCGRPEAVVGILYSNKPEQLRQRVNNRIDICPRCGEIIMLLSLTEEPDKDRTRRWERDLPK